MNPGPVEKSLPFIGTDYSQTDFLHSYQHVPWSNEKVIHEFICRHAIMNEEGMIITRNAEDNTYEFRRQVYDFLNRENLHAARRLDGILKSRYINAEKS